MKVQWQVTRSSIPETADFYLALIKDGKPIFGGIPAAVQQFMIENGLCSIYEITKAEVN